MLGLDTSSKFRIPDVHGSGTIVLLIMVDVWGQYT